MHIEVSQTEVRGQVLRFQPDHFFSPAHTPDFFKQQLGNACMKLLIGCRFDQKGLCIYSNIEQLFFKAASGAFESEFSIVCDFCKEEFDVNEFEAQLKVFQTLCRGK